MKKIILIFIISFSSLLAKDCTDLREDMIEQFDKVSSSNSQNSYDLNKLQATSKKTMFKCREDALSYKEAKAINKDSIRRIKDKKKD
mgnify:FL=1